MNTPQPANQVAPLASTESEQSLLGALLLNNEVFGITEGLVKAEHFYDPFHRTVFELISRQILAGKKATAISIAPALPKGEIGPGVTAAQYLVRLVSETPSLIDAPDYARAIRDYSAARAVAMVSDDIRQMQGNGLLVDDIISRAWDDLDAIRQGVQEVESTVFSIGDAAQRTAETLVKQRNGEGDTVVRTGLVEYDRAIGGGLRAGRLYIEAGRPGAGKTVLALANARRVAKAGHGVGFFSLELDEAEISARLLAAELSRTDAIPYRDILTGENMDDRRHEAVVYASERMAEWPLMIDTTPAMSIAQIAAKAAMMKAAFKRKGVKLAAIWVDYLGLIRMPERTKNTNSVLDLGDIVVAAKNLGRKLDCAVTLLSQLNRGVESREDKRPVMSDLRQSGAIEEHADVVTLLYRPSYYLAKTPDFRNGKEEALAEMQRIKYDQELLTDKNRLGPTGVHHVWADVSLNQVEDLAR